MMKMKMKTKMLTFALKSNAKDGAKKDISDNIRRSELNGNGRRLAC